MKSSEAANHGKYESSNGTPGKQAVPGNYEIDSESIDSYSTVLKDRFVSFQRKLVCVKNILSSRYENHTKPFSWDHRIEGEDVIETEEGEVISLFSDGGQSPPKPRWVILLTSRLYDEASEFKSEKSSLKYMWTLYGMKEAE
jgi:hypothetical protein